MREGKWKTDAWCFLNGDGEVYAYNIYTRARSQDDETNVCVRSRACACVCSRNLGRAKGEHRMYIYIHLSICGAKVISGFRRRTPRGTYIYIYIWTWRGIRAEATVDERAWKRSGGKRGNFNKRGCLHTHTNTLTRTHALVYMGVI